MFTKLLIMRIMGKGSLHIYKLKHSSIIREGGIILMADNEKFLMDGTKLVQYLGKDTEVIVPENTTEIGEKAFFCCTWVREVILPEGIRTIENKAFSTCTGLKRINLPASLEVIGEMAFELCIGFFEFAFPKSLKELGDYAFWCCPFLRKVRISKETKRDEEKAFDHCDPNLSISYYED